MPQSATAIDTERQVASPAPRVALVLGAGRNGPHVAEALVRQGASATVFERGPVPVHTTALIASASTQPASCGGADR